VESKDYDTFRKQDFVNSRKRAYEPGSPLRIYPGVKQQVFEVDMKRLIKFHIGQQRGKSIDMTDSNTLTNIDKAVKKMGLGSSTVSAEPKAGLVDRVKTGFGAFKR
jgi:hypothetical protein